MATLELKRCDHQVGGHMTADKKPDTMVDSQGRFYKPYQADDRNVREAAFYTLLWGPSGADPENTPGTSYDTLPRQEEWGQGPAFLGKNGTAKPEDVEGLRKFVPKSFGVVEADGRKFVVMEDVCAAYKQPCVIDLKMGFTTVYEWGPSEKVERNRQKDNETTQTDVGFRVCGLQVYDKPNEEMKKSDRLYGRLLTKDNVTEAFVKYAGSFPIKELYQGSGGVLEKIQPIRDWFAIQTSFCFFQASLLITYEGTADSVQDANVQVHWIDFAHTFPSAGEQDKNVLMAIDSLTGLLKKLE